MFAADANNGTKIAYVNWANKTEKSVWIKFWLVYSVANDPIDVSIEKKTSIFFCDGVGIV